MLLLPAALRLACLSSQGLHALADLQGCRTPPQCLTLLCARSIGNIKPIFSYQYPHCFGTAKPSVCNANEQRAPDYTQILGIIFGMITLGFIGDKIGRAPACLAVFCAAAALQASCIASCTLSGAAYASQKPRACSLLQRLL